MKSLRRMPDGMPSEQGAAEPKDAKFDRMVGYVQRYSVADGWGVLRSTDLEGEFTFHSDEIMPEFQTHRFGAADPVEFTVQVNEQGLKMATLVKPKLGRSAHEAVGTRCRGYVRRFAERWGFLNAASFDGDLFVHRDNILPAGDMPSDGKEPLLAAGQVVEFDVMLDDRGRVVAKMITTRIPSQPSDWMGQRIGGFVRSFQDRWGFLNSERFVGDLFVHRDGLLPQYQNVNLVPGTVVEFDVRHDDHRQDSRNRLVARNVAVLHVPQSAETASVQQIMPAVQPTVAATAYGTPASYGTPPSQHMHQQQPTYGGQHLQSMVAHPPPMQPQQMMVQSDFQAHPTHPVPLQLPQAMPPQQAQYGVQAHVAPFPPATSPLATNPYFASAYAQSQQVTGDASCQPQLYAQQYGTCPAQGYGQQAPQQVYAEVVPVNAMDVYGQTQPLCQMPITQPAVSYTVQPVVEQQCHIGGQAPPTVAGTNQIGNGVSCAALPQHAPVMAPPLLPNMTAPHLHVDNTPAQQIEAFQPLPGLLHIAVQNWDPGLSDQPGQMALQAGVLVGVTQEAAHGWVYATQPGRHPKGGVPVDGWVPKAMLKKVTLCQVVVDWLADSNGTLSVRRGDLIAVSHEAERGWVYGERCWGYAEPPVGMPLLAGWVPKKVVEVVQS